MTDDENDSPMPRPLPVVYVGGTAYFIDMRLQELREVDKPHRRIPFVKGLEPWLAVFGKQRDQELSW